MSDNGALTRAQLDEDSGAGCPCEECGLLGRLLSCEQCNGQAFRVAYQAGVVWLTCAVCSTDDDGPGIRIKVAES